MIIYKYYSPKDYNFEALQQNYLYFRKVSKTNDPYDCSCKLLQNKAICKYLENMCHIDETSLRTMNDYATCSFSKHKNNKRLWASYADNYSGFVIGFNIEKLSNLCIDDCIRIPLYEVNYIDSLSDALNEHSSIECKSPTDENMNFTLEIAKLLNEYKCDFKEIEHLFYYICSIKEKTSWAIEEEYRLMIGRDGNTRLCSLITKENNGFKVSFPCQAVEEIIIGHNFDVLKYGNIINKIWQKYNVETIKQTICEVPFEVNFKNIKI